MTVRDTGRRTFFHQRGANAHLAPPHIDFSRTSARHLHIGYALLLDYLDAAGPDGRPRLAAVLRAARQTGLSTSIDCVSEHSDRFGAVIAPLLPEVDILFANDFEAEKLTGLDLGRGATLDKAALVKAAQILISRGVHQLVVIHCPEGVLAASPAEHFWQPSVALPAELIVGAAGAGDALAAGVLYGCHEGWRLDRSLELGVCAAAASLRDVTCSAKVETVAACLALGRIYGYRAP